MNAFVPTQSSPAQPAIRLQSDSAAPAASGNSSFRMAATISIGLLAWCGGVAAAGKVYVANEAADTLSVIDATSFKVLTQHQLENENSQTI